MASATFDRARIEALLQDAVAQLDGEWLLVGGAAAAAWFSSARTTEDIDLIGLGGTQAERLALMEFAVASGLPVEAVNSAADFFVRRIEGWREAIVPLVTGARATIYRPSATLFLLLKCERLSATDVSDCLALLAHCRAEGGSDPIDADRVRARVAALPATDDVALRERRAALRAAL